jgi:hypothetical protein
VRLVFVIVLAGCGRIGIDPLAQSDARLADASIDAAPVACTIEGTPCDDQNICTPSSTCQSGVCTGDPPLMCTVANSETEFDTVQGTNSWFYGFWDVSNDVDATYQGADYQQLALFDGAWRHPSWQPVPSPDFSWMYVVWWGAHPSTLPITAMPVRRWVSDVSGRANVVISFSKSDASGGDGTRAILAIDGQVVWMRAVEGTDGDGFTEALPIDLAIGTTVDLLLDPIADEGSDSSDQKVLIEAR